MISRVPRHRSVFALLLALTAGCGIVTLAPALHVQPIKAETVDFPLPSGLRVVFQEDRARAVVSVATVVGTGFAEDPAGQEGMAHLLEHLAFRAHHFSGDAVATRLDELGARHNAFTTTDDTTYVADAPRQSLAELLRLEAARLLDPLEGIDEATFAHERDVVVAETRQQWFAESVYPALLARLYPAGNRYHHPTSSRESLDRISLADVRRFATAWYRPDNTTVVIAGDFDRTTANALLASAFPRALVAGKGEGESREIHLATPTPRVPSTSLPPPAPATTAIETVPGPVAEPEVFLAWALPGGYRKDAAVMSAAVGALGEVIGASIGVQRGGKGTSWKRGWFRQRFHSASCRLETQRDSSVALCRIRIVEGQSGREVAEDALNGLYRFSSAGDPRTDYLSSMFAESSLSERTRTGARYIHYTSHADRFEKSFEDLGAVNEDVIRSFAGKWLTRARVVAIVYEPDVKAVGATSAVAAGAAEERATDAALELPPSPDWFASLTPARIEAVARSGEVREVRELTLANGLRIIIARNPAVPLVHAALYTRGGANSATPVGLPYFVRHDWDSPDPSGFAGTWNSTNFDDAELIGIDAPSSYLGDALATLGARARTTRATWDKLSYNVQLDGIEKLAARSSDSPSQKAHLAVLARLFPAHPIAAPLEVAQLRKLGHRDFSNWIETTLVPRNATLIVAGDLKVTEAEDLIVAGWSDWSSKKQGQPLPPMPAPAGETPRTFVAAATQHHALVAVEVGCRLPFPSSRDVATREVLTRLLETDLDDALRQSAGATYGVDVGASEWEGGSALLAIRSKIAVEKTAAALRTILDRIEALARGEVSASALARAKWSLARDGALANETAAATVSQFLGPIHDGMPIDDLQFRPRWAAQTTAKDIATQIAPCANHEVVATAGPIEPARDVAAALKIPLTLAEDK